MIDDNKKNGLGATDGRVAITRDSVKM